MQNIIYIALGVSAVLNVALFVRNVIWKGRAVNVLEAIHGTNRRLKATFNVLWAQAEAAGEKDKDAFTSKIIMLSETPEPFQLEAAKKLGILDPAKAQKTLGFH